MRAGIRRLLRKVGLIAAEGPDETTRLLPKGPRLSEVTVSPSHPELCDVEFPHGHGVLARPDPLAPFIKYFMILLTAGCCLVGSLVVSVGLWGLVTKQSLAGENVGSLGTDPMLLLTLAGLVTSFLSVSGCVGFLRENLCLLRTYLGGITTVVVAQCLVALVVLGFQQLIMDWGKKLALTAISRYQDDSDLRFILDEVQLGMQCCGAQSYEDWSINLYYNCSSPGVSACSVPYSCCLHPLQNGTVPNSQCGFGALALERYEADAVIYLGGCIPALTAWIRLRMWDIVVACIVLTSLEIICIACAQRMIATIQALRARY